MERDGGRPRRGEGRGARGGYVAAYPATTGVGLGSRIGAGASGGAWAAVVMALAAMLAETLLGRGPLTFLRMVAAVVYGPDAMAGTAPVLAGLGIHILTGIAFGVLFALLFGRSAGNLVLWGIAYGAAVWAFAQYVSLPATNPTMAAWVRPDLYLLYHVIFGAMLGGYLTEWRSRGYVV